MVNKICSNESIEAPSCLSWNLFLGSASSPVDNCELDLALSDSTPLRNDPPCHPVIRPYPTNDLRPPPFQAKRWHAHVFAPRKATPLSCLSKCSENSAPLVLLYYALLCRWGKLLQNIDIDIENSAPLVLLYYALLCRWGRAHLTAIRNRINCFATPRMPVTVILHAA